MAVSENTTALPVARRRLFAVLGLLATVPAASAPLVAASPWGDSHKIALALADLRAADADRRGIEARSHEIGTLGICPESKALEATLAEAADRLYDAMFDLVEARAVTLADMQAKAEGLRLALKLGVFRGRDAPDAEDGNPEDWLGWSLAADILAIAPQPMGGRA